MSGGDGPAGARRRLTLAYDGTDFAGWQVQPGRRTVQGVLEAALADLLGLPVRVHGAGRTDAGVHALGQVAHFDETRGLPLPRLAGALGARLPPDLRVVALERAPDGFHALHSARRKTYFYQLHLSGLRGGLRAVEASVPPHRRRSFHAVPAGLDREAMRAAAAALVGRHDFLTFSKAMPAGRTTVKRLEAVRVRTVPRGLRLFFSGEGFLYGMARLLAGLLVEVGRGRVRAEAVPDLLAARDRNLAPASLPARGLFLWRVDYGPPGQGGTARGSLLS